MKLFILLLAASPLLFAEAVDMPGQNPGNNSAAEPGINPNDSIFPTPASPYQPPKVEQAQKPGPYGY